MATYQDRVYARPWILGTRVLYYNRSLLRKAGFADDFLPLSWSHLMDVAKKVTDLGDDIYGWGSNTAEKHRLYKKVLPFFWSVRGQLISDDGRYCVVSSQQIVEALKFYRELHECCGYVANQRGIEDAFLDGKVGMVLSGDWLLKRIELEKRSIDFETVVMPGPNPTFGTGRQVVAGFRNLAYPGKSFMGGEFLLQNILRPLENSLTSSRCRKIRSSFAKLIARRIRRVAKLKWMITFRRTSICRPL
jgi:ABC-type glycerol-3-phosphate transport system substrate-binding protein